MRLYLVWDSEGICERTDSIVEDLFEAVDGDTDSEAAPRRRKDKKRKKKSSSDSSEDDEDKDEESGSDSESEKVGLDYWVCFPDCLLSQKMSSMPRKICPNAFQPCMFSLLKNRLGQLMILISLMALRHHVGVQIHLLSSSGKDEEEEEE